MRLVLENSTHREVPVEKDIEALKLYIYLETVRYDHAFRYELQVDPELLKEEYKIPPLLLQPYVENAIKHGLGNKESGKGVLKITLTLKNKQIICEISDNGIGRTNAEAMKKIQSPENTHRSLGMAVTESRINLLKELSYGNASVNIIDLNGDGTGTLIKIVLPAD
jgi:LytS/YehU family sensor histidine kinase